LTIEAYSPILKGANMPRMKKKTEYYVNNKEFLEAITLYRNAVIKAREAEDPRPRVPNYIGECFLKIATHLSYKPNFVNYMFREDMICDGIENCLQYIDNFNPEKSSNPFAYFTQIIYYAFLRRIQKEKKQMEIKNKILEKSGYDEVMHTDTYTGDMQGMNANQADMGSIKENIEIKMNR
tara:strand:+ start:4674 stop:5213 length:540 start_codon:yes stop_codon:yes gene_type:complete